MSQPDLFVVCKNCGSEVSPYVTECPYCGQRVRKRAPKLDRREAEAREGRRRGRPRLPRLRTEEIEGIAPEIRPYATIAIIAASLAVTLVVQAGVALTDVGGLFVGAAFSHDDVWRYFTTSFVYNDLGYLFAVMVATGIFGTLLERRYGPVPVVCLFVLAGAAGAAAAAMLEVKPLFDYPGWTAVLGANGAALGLLAAWLVQDRIAARRGQERSSDLLGVGVVASVLVLLSVAVREANIVAAAAGAAAGGVLGLVLPLFTRRAVY